MATKKNRGAHIVAGAMNTLSYVLLIIGLSLIISTVGVLWANDVLALVKADQPATLKLTEDTASGTVASQLKEAGVIRYPFLFKLMTSFKHIDQFDAGTYELNSSMDYGQLMDALQTAQTTRGVVTVTIPEGYNLKEICALLVEKNVVREAVFWDVVNHYDFAHFMLQDVPMTDNRLEGYLFPDTYEFFVNEDPSHAICRLLDNFSQRMDDELMTQVEESGYSLEEILIIASLIEKETDGKDRTNIASVIYNRLNNVGETYHKLEIDAAVIYGLGYANGENYAGPLTQADLDKDTPYNLRMHEGLPPTPICNPGLASIRAALEPADTNYYFYALGKDGVHHFFKTYREHVNFVNSSQYGG